MFSHLLLNVVALPLLSGSPNSVLAVRTEEETEPERALKTTQQFPKCLQ